MILAYFLFTTLFYFANLCVTYGQEEVNETEYYNVTTVRPSGDLPVEDVVPMLNENEQPYLLHIWDNKLQEHYCFSVIATLQIAITTCTCLGSTPSSSALVFDYTYLTLRTTNLNYTEYKIKNILVHPLCTSQDYHYDYTLYNIGGLKIYGNFPISIKKIPKPVTPFGESWFSKLTTETCAFFTTYQDSYVASQYKMLYQVFRKECFVDYCLENGDSRCMNTFNITIDLTKYSCSERTNYRIGEMSKGSPIVCKGNLLGLIVLYSQKVIVWEKVRDYYFVVLNQEPFVTTEKYFPNDDTGNISPVVVFGKLCILMFLLVLFGFIIY